MAVRHNIKYATRQNVKKDNQTVQKNQSIIDFNILFFGCANFDDIKIKAISPLFFV